MTFELRRIFYLLLNSLAGLALFCLLRGNPAAAGLLLLAATAVLGVLLVTARPMAPRSRPPQLG